MSFVWTWASFGISYSNSHSGGMGKPVVFHIFFPIKGWHKPTDGWLFYHWPIGFLAERLKYLVCRWLNSLERLEKGGRSDRQWLARCLEWYKMVTTWGWFVALGKKKHMKRLKPTNMTMEPTKVDWLRGKHLLKPWCGPWITWLFCRLSLWPPKNMTEDSWRCPDAAPEEQTIPTSAALRSN